MRAASVEDLRPLCEPAAASSKSSATMCRTRRPPEEVIYVERPVLILTIRISDLSIFPYARLRLFLLADGAAGLLRTIWIRHRGGL